MGCVELGRLLSGRGGEEGADCDALPGEAVSAAPAAAHRGLLSTKHSTPPGLTMRAASLMKDWMAACVCM